MPNVQPKSNKIVHFYIKRLINFCVVYDKASNMKLSNRKGILMTMLLMN